jgi:hypothetical protein
MNPADTLSAQLLSSFAVDILKKISKKTKIDVYDLASSVPGLVHAHWYVADAPVTGCVYCKHTGDCCGGGRAVPVVSTEDPWTIVDGYDSRLANLCND